MSNKTALNFSIGIDGDGSTSTYTADLRSDPFIFQAALSNTFDILKNLPTGALSASPAAYVISISGFLLTVVFATPSIPNGPGTISGVFTFG